MSLDTSDLDRWVGKKIGGANLKDPIHVNDIRRWAQGMQNPHPLYFDEKWAQESRFGRIVAPQSFAVCASDSHGAAPSIQGRIDGSHMLFGGDEWWFFGPRIAPGDRIRQERVFDGYDVKETKFAGPTVFARGDTTYINHRQEPVAKQRSTSIRYLVAEAQKRRSARDEREPVWSDAEIAQIERKKLDYHKTFLDLGHAKRSGIAVGDVLPERILGPHSITSFATEWRSYLMTVWGAFEPDGLETGLRKAGWLPEMDKDMNAAKIDPALADGAYKGSSRGHLSDKHAQLIGMPRGYGYGASMGAWVLDYAANWAGEHGEIVHSKVQYRSPALTGDLTILSGVVASSSGDLVVLQVEMKNQRDLVLAQGSIELRV
jgi:hypothetical protein